MSELKLISPLLDGLEIVKCVQSGGGTSVYLLRSAHTGQQYMLKHISVPESQTQVDALLFTGAAADEAAAQAYYEQVVNDYRDELTDLELLRGSTNFAAYLDYQICPKEEGIGFELYLLSEKWPTLVEYLSENAMTHLKALNLALDLCTALTDLRAQGLIHRDVKPENIYLNGLNGFMLGDLGVARIDNLKYCAMPERMVTEYTAPEMTDILSVFNTTIDIYSVGMVLYRILNGNHGPFEDEKTSPKAANKLRISGEPLPAPLYSDYELTEIILKACAFEPTDRYQTPEELMQELVLYMKRNSVTDSLIVPPIVADPEDELPPDLQEEEVEPVRFADVEKMDEEFVANFSPDTQSLGAIIDEVRREAEADGGSGTPEPRQSGSSPPADGAPPGPAFAAPHTTARPPSEEDDPQKTDGESPPPRKKKPKLWIPISVAAGLLCVIAVSLYFLVFGGPPLHIHALEITDRGIDFLTVTVDAEAGGTALELRCTDTYGNTQTASYTGEAITFSDLTSGAQYTISLSSPGRKRLTGETSFMASTVAATEIVSFTAASSLAGEADLKLVISGPSPEEWTVRYSAEGVEPKEVSFAGNSVSIFNLEVNRVYLFELLPPDGISLSGETKLEFSTGPEIEVTNLEAASLSRDAVRVTWDCGENLPENWSVTCTGTDGLVKTQTVTDCEAEFTGLTTGETYTISVTSSGTLTPAVITVTPTAAAIDSLDAALQEDGTVRVSWSASADGAAWQLFYTVQGTELSDRMEVTGSEAILTGLIPGRTYEIELRSGNGEKLAGPATAEITVPAAEQFHSYGASRFFMGLFLRPDRDNWTGKDLAAGTTEFTAAQRIAFAVESLTGRSSSGEEVSIVYVVEDASGIPVQTGSSTASWNDMWNSDLFVGELEETPQAPGSYTLRLYFNGQSVASKEFTIQS